jgi:sulfoxide reductase heme-binding subunit YedZ
MTVAIKGRQGALTPWRERNGRLSWLRLCVFLLLLAPGLWIAANLVGGTLGAKPVTEAIHLTGTWAIRFLVLSLLVTPLRRVTGWNRVTGLRRMIGLAAAAYAVAHFSFYAVDQGLDLAAIGREIVLRIYLAIGFVAFVGLAVLAATSTDGAIRRMGPAWHRLHRLVYPLAFLACLHFFMQSKADVSEATLVAGAFASLMLFRLAAKAGLRLSSPVVVVGIAVVAGLSTAAIEYLWYALATGVPAARVLAANLDFSYSIRPAWWVFGGTLSLAVLAAAGRQGRRLRHPPASGSPRPARSTRS